eukprot:NODE_3228_length_2071_cov_7.442901.p1 GENE.NODE_3228_length_2071_cov_7.442901~~NODE_3228_length_2071_cov_7.442901.p1  ORF type:complete len:592 (-),score=174.38 NODE_3228_length_2071_cov_7.442901:135-1910(-)
MLHGADSPSRSSAGAMSPSADVAAEAGVANPEGAAAASAIASSTGAGEAAAAAAAGSAAGGAACVTVMVGSAAATPASFRLRAGGSPCVRIGRDPTGNDVIIASRGTSAFHAELLLRTCGGGAQHELCVRDLSTNGTGLEMPGGAAPARVRHGVPTPLGNSGAVLVIPAPHKKSKPDTSMRLTVRLDSAELSTAREPTTRPAAAVVRRTCSRARRLSGGYRPKQQLNLQQQQAAAPSAPKRVAPAAAFGEMTPVAKRRRFAVSPLIVPADFAAVACGPLLPLRLVVFDFDQTLSELHVFKTLAGLGGPFMLPPYARTELGQVLRISELDSLSPFADRGGFALAAFGGRDRAMHLRQQLEDLQDKGLELLVCTKGLVGAAQKCLEDVGIRHCFSAVYGNIGDVYGETAFDTAAVATPEALRLLGSERMSGWTSKDSLIGKLMEERGLAHISEACLVEDDPEEVDRANYACRTLLITPPRGMRARHFAELRNMAAPQSPDDVPALYLPPGLEVAAPPTAPTPRRFADTARPLLEGIESAVPPAGASPVLRRVIATVQPRAFELLAGNHGSAPSAPSGSALHAAGPACAMGEKV